MAWSKLQFYYLGTVVWSLSDLGTVGIRESVGTTSKGVATSLYTVDCNGCMGLFPGENLTGCMELSGIRVI